MNRAGRTLRAGLCAAALLLLWAGRPDRAGAEGQAAPDSGAAAAATGAVRVFIDCSLCGRSDLDYYRAHIAFVDHVRAPAAAQVHLIVTGQSTGGGGDELTLTFLGRGPFTGMDDTLRCVTRASDTDEAIRRATTRTMQLGLMRYAARTPVASRIAIGYDDSAATEAPAMADRWHNWVFSTRVSGDIYGQSTTRRASFRLSQSVSRVTLERKFGLTVSGSYYESRYTLSDGERLLSISRYREVGGRYVWSLGDHWSTMVRGRAYASTYENVEFQIGAGSGVEYNVFPYSESTRRQLRIAYTAGVRNVRYFQPTLYDKTRETLYRQGIEVLLDSREPWGSSQLRLEAQHFFPDLYRHRLEASGSVSLRLTEGLSLDLRASGERIRDQLSLPRASASDEEILLQRRQLATGYQYGFSVGLSYTFGSIFNNVVNPRFGSGA
ncbi:MAG: hypothetical protein AAB113_08415 [Candidatus Eisenbacteria bacterium]